MKIYLDKVGYFFMPENRENNEYLFQEGLLFQSVHSLNSLQSESFKNIMYIKGCAITFDMFVFFTCLTILIVFQAAKEQTQDLIVKTTKLQAEKYVYHLIYFLKTFSSRSDYATLIFE